MSKVDEDLLVNKSDGLVNEMLAKYNEAMVKAVGTSVRPISVWKHFADSAKTGDDGLHYDVASLRLSTRASNCC